MGLNLKSLGSKIFDQLNPLDNGRTYKQRTPTNDRSIVGQLAHNGLTNTVGNFTVKPAFQTLNASVIEPSRALTAQLTNNRPALLASNEREKAALHGSIPGFFIDQGLNGGQALFNLGFKAPINDLLGNSNVASQARNTGLQEFNRTVPGALARPIEYGIANANHASNAAQAEAGLDPTATGAQKYFADPLTGAAALFGLKRGLGRSPKPRVSLKQPKISELGGNRPNDSIQTAIEQAHNSGDAAAVEKLITQLPEADQPAMRSAMGLKPLVTKTGDLTGLEPLSPYTKAPKAPGAFARAWQTVGGIISQHGTGGKEIARRLGEQRNASEIGQQAFLDSIPTVSKLSKQDFTTFVDTLDRTGKGESVNVAPNIQQAVAEWNQAIPKIRQRATEAGLDVGDLGPNYFPRQYKDLFTGDKAMAKLAQGMVDSGKATNLGDAIGKLQFMKREYQRPFGNLEKTREFDLPGYEKTPEALGNYLSRSFDRITKAEQFGGKNEILNQLLGRAQQEGYNATPGSTLDKYVKIALGDVDKGTVAHKVSGAVRNINAVRSLSTAQLSNATQLTNTATIAGFGRTVKAIVTAATSKEARAQAKQTGVTLEHSLGDLSKQGLGVKGIVGNLASPFFKQVERFNRQATAIVGKDYGNALAKKASKGSTKAEATLRDKFGVTGDVGEKLTRDQEIQVSRKLVELSQFKVDPVDLPGWVDSPMGKLVAQFRTFGYKQSDFMYNQVLREALKGNPLPLARFVAVAVPAGGLTLAAKGAIKGTSYTQPGESNVSKATKALAAVGGFGLPGSEGQNLYKSAQYGNTIGGLAGTVGGPTLSAVVETVANVDKAIGGNSTALKKEGLRNIPVVGGSLANRVFPAKPQAPEANSKGTPAEKDAAAVQEKAAMKETAGQGYDLRPLSNGKYAYSLDGDTTVHETPSLAKAREAVARDTFSKSDKDKQLSGDIYYLKHKDGSVFTEPKVRYEANQDVAKTTLELDRAYGARDAQKYANLASNQIDSWEKLKTTYNPDTEQDRIDALTLKQENLRDKAIKYLTSGINGGGSGGSRRGVSTPHVPTVSLSSGGGIGKKLSVAAIRNNAPRTVKRVVTKSAPRVTLTKSRI